MIEKDPGCGKTIVEIPAKEFKEKAVQTVSEAILGIKSGLQKKILTVMDIHAFPEEILDEDGEELTLKEWIEKEVHSLNSPEDFEHFTRMLQLSHTALCKEGRGPFLPKRKIDGRDFKPNSNKVVRLIESGIKNDKDAESLFGFTQLDLHKNVNDFLVDRRAGKNGHERYTACRILKRAFAMSEMEKSMKDVGQWARYVFGMDGSPDEQSFGKFGDKPEIGLFMGSQVSKNLFDAETARREDREFQNWELVEDILKKPSMMIFDSEDGQHESLHGIKFIELSFKDANEAIRKMERKGQITPEDIDELFRFRIVLESIPGENDGVCRHRKLKILSQIDKIASGRKERKIPIKVETRTINGLQHFSDDEDENLEFQKAYVDRIGFSDFKHKRKEGTLSGGGYRNFSQKIKHCDPKTRKPIFTCEMQLVDEQEYKHNENPTTTAAHFPRKIEAVGGMELPRTDSVMTRKQYIAHLEAWLRNYNKRHPEKIAEVWKLLDASWAEGATKGGLPKKLEGTHIKRPGWKSTPGLGVWRRGSKEEERFTFDFAPGGGTISDKKFKDLARNAFEYLFASGQVRKVPQNFPSQLTGGQTDLEKSSLFLGNDAYCRIASQIPKVELKKT